MKKTLILLFFAVSFLFFVKESLAATPINKACLGMKVRFTAGNWPKNTKIDIACAGNTNPLGCKGTVLHISPNPNTRYVLPNCTCPPFSKGCLFIGQNLTLVSHYSSALKTTLRVVEGNINKVPAGCKLTRYGGQCGKNGNVIQPSFRIQCKVSPTPTPEVTGTPTPTPKITETPTPTPSICVGPKVVTNVKVTCPSCFSDQDLQDAKKKLEDANK